MNENVSTNATPANEPRLLRPPAGCRENAQSAAVRVREKHPDADPLAVLPDVHPARIPRHVAIIMDGNGRWAIERGLPREIGHHNGAKTVRTVLTECARLGIEFLTLYSFSLENWKRPKDEIEALMRLCVSYCDSEREELLQRNVRCRVIGRREGLPGHVLDALDRLVGDTAACTGTTLVLAINYASRAEIVDAARAIARDAAAGTLDPESLDERAFASRLYTAGIPDPDLLVRTAGELRLSNYLLWQISYAELFVTERLWPDFSVSDLHQAVRAYAGRNRTFGGLA